MKISPLRITGLALLFSAVDLILPYSAGISMIRDAQAVVGRPATPVSYAGVARRSAVGATGAAAVATTAAVTTAAATTAVQASAQQAAVAQQQAATAQQQAAVAQQQAATAQRQATGGPPIGTVVPVLPAGCVSAPKSGVEYQNCGGVYYRPAFQGNNLVYVVDKQ
jgi:hypothetical protein